RHGERNLRDLFLRPFPGSRLRRSLGPAERRRGRDGCDRSLGLIAFYRTISFTTPALSWNVSPVSTPRRSSKIPPTLLHYSPFRLFACFALSLPVFPREFALSLPSPPLVSSSF